MSEYNYPSCLLKPGGIKLTRELISSHRIKPGEQILDVGCGCGESAAYICEQYQAKVIGIDMNNRSIREAKERYSEAVFQWADVRRLPFADESFDAVIAECTLSLIDPLEAAVKEIARVSKTGGRLYISDLYIKIQEDISGKGMVKNLYTMRQYTEVLHRFGYAVVMTEDKSHVLKQMVGQMIFDMGMEKTWEMLGLCGSHIKGKNIGYMLLTAKRWDDDDKVAEGYMNMRHLEAIESKDLMDE